ncbi:hypothetical protein V6N11_067732 [Hibiscus sabdariffa]|uniref:Uncharacterized protein n=1 Tax=Hibiscus sabdariffa TaxID=183260 RepID=A0ABR2SRQ3_9ROSI
MANMNDGSASDDEELEYIAFDNQDSDSDSSLEDSENDLADGDDEVCHVHVVVVRDIPRFSAGTRNDNEENGSETKSKGSNSLHSVRRSTSFNAAGSRKQNQLGSQHPQGSINIVRWMPQSQNLQTGSQNTQGSINTFRWMLQSQDPQSGSQHTQGSIKTSQHQAQTQEDPASKRLRWR